MRRIINFEVEDLACLTDSEKKKIHYLNDFYSVVLNWKKNLLKVVFVVIHAWMLQYIIANLNTLGYDNTAFAGTIVTMLFIFISFKVANYIEINVRKEPFSIRLMQK